jgi:hypothetical protein
LNAKYQDKVSDLDKKVNSLKEQTLKYMRFFEEERNLRENQKIKISEDLKLIEDKVTNTIKHERAVKYYINKAK